MKIITLTPALPPLEDPWWIGKEITCGSCGTVFAMEKGDKPVNQRIDKVEGIICRIDVDCPACKEMVVVPRPFPFKVVAY